MRMLRSLIIRLDKGCMKSEPQFLFGFGAYLTCNCLCLLYSINSMKHVSNFTYDSIAACEFRHIDLLQRSILLYLTKLH